MKATVLIACRNGADFVAQALESVYAQTLALAEYEIVFVNDGSADATEKAIGPYRHRPNFRYLANPTSAGLARACNQGLEASRAPYVVRLDADDTFDPPLLEEMCGPMDRGITDFVSCDRREKNLLTGKVQTVTIQPFNLFHLIAIGTLLRRELLLKIGGWRDLFLEEYDLYLRYLSESPFPPCHVPKALLTYAIRSGSMTSDSAHVREGWQELRALWPQELLQRMGSP